MAPLARDIVRALGQRLMVTITTHTDMQVGMAEWSKLLPPVRGVAGLILGHDIL